MKIAIAKQEICKIAENLKFTFKLIDAAEVLDEIRFVQSWTQDLCTNSIQFETVQIQFEQIVEQH
jgi:hypothetical protein